MIAALRKWLFAGLLVLVPLIITLWVLDWVVSTLDQTLRVLPVSWQPDQWLGVHIPGLGVLFALVVLLSIGALASNIIGNKLVHWWHAMLHRIPVVRSIYSGVKQTPCFLKKAMRSARPSWCSGPTKACGPSPS